MKRELNYWLHVTLQHIEVNKPSRSRTLDNLEFMQWMKHYFDSMASTGTVSSYDAESRRQESKRGASFSRQQVGCGWVGRA